MRIRRKAEDPLGVDRGDRSLFAGDAYWTPVACSEHDERGFQPGCAGCEATAAQTIRHARAVLADRESA